MSDSSLLDPIAAFLGHRVSAFSSLTTEELRQLAHHCQVDYQGRGKEIMVQGETQLEFVYIIHRGAVELYYENNQEIEHDLLSEGGLYGALSLLRNKGISLRSAKTAEDTFFYLIPKDIFFQICTHHDEVRSFFFGSLQTRTYERSLAEFRKKRLRPREDYDSYVMHLSVGEVISPNLTHCSPQTTLREAAITMTENQTGYMVVLDEGKQPLGIITDSDLRRGVIAGDLSRDASVASSMMTPVKTIPADSPVLEGLMTLVRYKIAYLPAVNPAGQVIGVLSGLDLPQVRQRGPLNLIYRIRTRETPEELTAIKAQLPTVISNLFQEGYAVEQITGFIAHINDTVLSRLVELALERLGEPPCRFAFIALGSEGREEQTLIVDQDNGIIIEDGADDAAIAWFRNLGALICTWLDQAGYTYCKGNVMATNEDWCQPLVKWCGYFDHWIEQPEPMAVMHSQIFFDFRPIHGDTQLAVQLREHLNHTLKGRVDLFFRMLASHHVKERPPIGFFRNFIVASKGDHKDLLDLKKTMNFAVDFARIHALAHGICTTNTLARLAALRDLEVLEETEYEALKRGYNYMMSLRLHHQLDALVLNEGEAGNFIDPYKLSDLDQDMLKAVFKLLGQMQRKVSLRFLGNA